MDNNDIFESNTRSAGDQVGVFEYDGETGYFYLYDTTGKDSRKVLGAIHVLTDTPDFEEHDVAIRWDSLEQAVGLFIRDHLWAAFDLQTGTKYGGNYRSSNLPEIPEAICNVFKSK
jgi:hypothetical protein